ncbi:hypothetical protein PG999_014727 [Apiospora kogelbergensis]|uniref:Uncharacterized protein n=1 Tax=Apiospora kogelbergensis TaxID=1337665 RepID=A0AAW0QI11_9PEZI
MTVAGITPQPGLSGSPEAGSACLRKGTGVGNRVERGQQLLTGVVTTTAQMVQVPPPSTLFNPILNPHSHLTTFESPAMAMAEPVTDVRADRRNHDAVALRRRVCQILRRSCPLAISPTSAVFPRASHYSILLITLIIPYIDHLLGMLFYYGHYLSQIGQRQKYTSNFTLLTPGSRMHVVTDLLLAAAVQRYRTFSFTPIIPDTTKRLLGLETAAGAASTSASQGGMMDDAAKEGLL